MPRLTIKQVDAFTTSPFCGNPAGVITDADGLTSDDMLKIAGEMNLAETAFVTMPSSPESMFRIRYFTPTEEVDLSGHVTIACCYALIEDMRIDLRNGKTTVGFETNVGNISVEIDFSLGTISGDSGDSIEIETANGRGTLHKIMMRQTISDFHPSIVPLDLLSDILGLEKNDILGTGLSVEVISTGLHQLMVPVQKKETIQNLNPDLIKLGLMNKKYGIDTNHIFTLDTFNEDSVTYSRHFAPAVGMWEDPATGTAAAGLATYLLRHGIVSSDSMIMEQGRETDNQAKILVETDNTSECDTVKIGGLAVTSIVRELVIENEMIDIS
ncbi:MAG: PhzF family phenazine biosynthesis protein [Candidatus Krumholzibacteriota bacterium]|nr:PhzF family phenazine biosynthesis protein [Candidatus Krumholzibacteriota bacterium]